MKGFTCSLLCLVVSLAPLLESPPLQDNVRRPSDSQGLPPSETHRADRGVSPPGPFVGSDSVVLKNTFPPLSGRPFLPSQHGHSFIHTLIHSFTHSLSHAQPGPALSAGMRLLKGRMYHPAKGLGRESSGSQTVLE